MSVIEKQQKLIARYGILPGPQERLNALLDRGAKLPPFPVEEKTHENRVHGCQSFVWISGFKENDRCRFHCDADSPLVKGLIGILCELYDGGTVAEVLQVEPEIFDKLAIWPILSPTRQNGLTHFRNAICAIAQDMP